MSQASYTHQTLSGFHTLREPSLWLPLTPLLSEVPFLLPLHSPCQTHCNQPPLEPYLAQSKYSTNVHYCQYEHFNQCNTLIWVLHKWLKMHLSHIFLTEVIYTLEIIEDKVKQCCQAKMWGENSTVGMEMSTKLWNFFFWKESTGHEVHSAPSFRKLMKPRSINVMIPSQGQKAN